LTKARSKVIGESVEELVFDAVDELQPAEVPMDWDGAVDDYWHDATPERAIFSSEILPMVGICAIEPGTPVEIKSARAEISNGTRSRCGRFYLTRTQHERLIEENGVYLFAVYNDGSETELLGLLATLAVIVEEELRRTWYSAASREDYYQISAEWLPIDGLGGETDG